MELQEVKKIFDTIAATSSTNDKIETIKKYKDNELFKYCLKFLVSQDTTTGLSSKKVNKKLNLKLANIEFKNVIELCEYVLKNNTGTDQIIINVKNYIDNQPYELQEFLTNLVTKKIRLGCNVKLVNKAIPGLIYTHEVMLASKFEGVLKEPVNISLKLDGIRCSLLCEDGKIKALSRQGKEIIGLNEIIEDIKLLGLDGYFIDGELIRINHDNIPSDDNFRLTTKIVNSKDDNKTELEFVIFDMTPISDYHNKKCNTDYCDRLDYMLSLLCVEHTKHIRLVDNFGVTDDVNEVYKKLDEVVSKGYEGLMLNTLSGKYEFGKRPKSILKVKKMYTMDLRIIGFEEGQGAFSGTLGAILVDFKGNTVKVGSGFELQDRYDVWNNQEEYLGKIAEIQYFEISKNEKNNNESLRFPIFKRFRLSKEEVSYS